MSLLRRQLVIARHMFHEKMLRHALRVRKKLDSQTIQSGKQRLRLRDEGLLPSSIHVAVPPAVGERDLDHPRLDPPVLRLLNVNTDIFRQNLGRDPYLGLPFVGGLADASLA